jgi:hypothetical protein
MGVERIEQTALEKLRAPSPGKRQEVLDFVESLERKSLPKQPRRSLMGLCADLGIHTSEEDTTGARKEMRENFPREDV